MITQSTGLVYSITPSFSPCTFAVLPLASAIAFSGFSSVKEQRSPAVRRTPEGITPVRESASFRVMMRWRALLAIAIFAASTAALGLWLWRIT
jgi:cytochrome c biogenesis protein CcdA